MIRLIYINETILTPRQGYILNIINQSEGLLRREIQEKVEKLYPYRSIDEEEFKKALILFYEQLSIVHTKRLFIEQVKFANNNYFK